MLLPVGRLVLHRGETWTVVAVRAHTRVLRSLDGRRTAYESVDRLREAP
jgi:hypothetical protein